MNGFGNRFVLLTIVASLCAACGTVQPPGGGGHDLGPAPDPIPEGPPPAVSYRWSELPGGMPEAGADVTIPAGDIVLLDVSPPALGHVLIDGALVFDERDLNLTAESITVRGGLYIGSSDNEFANRATITLTGARQAGTEAGMGHRYLGTMAGGRIEIHGLSTHSWTWLTLDAHAGDRSITVADSAGWQVGDRIVIATTDYPQIEDDGPLRRERQTEERVITAIADGRLELDRALDFFHVGELMYVADRAVDQRAEVARLTRNVVIQGPGSVLDPEATDYGYGGHVMVMPGGTGRLSGVEFRRMGQRGILARYPVHFHLLRDGGRGSYVRHSAVHESFNRCVTIHGTNHVQVSDVVGFKSQGHCFFLEDGAETGNVLEGNLALSPMKPQSGFAILTSDDDGHLGPSGFWVTHPGNVLVGNHAVGSDGTGFWYALPENPTGDFRRAFPEQAAVIFPRTAPLGEFRDNTAHSNRSVGLHVDNGPTADLSGTPPTWYQPRDLNDRPVTAVFDNLNAWRNRDAGAWFRGDHAVLRGGMLSDNPIGVTFASSAAHAEGITFIGRTPNPGTPYPWDAGAADGFSIGRPWDPDFVVRGFEFYDGDVGVTDSFFAAYSQTAFPAAAALSYKDFTAFGVSPLNFSSGLTFAPDTDRVYLEAHVNVAEYPSDGYRSALFTDLDGSLTGTAGAVITVDNPFLRAHGCELTAGWGARICPPGTAFAALTLESAAGMSGVTISRGDGLQHSLAGNGWPQYRTLLLLDDEYAYDFTRVAEPLMLYLQEVAPGSLLHVSLPWASPSVFVYRDWWIDERSLLPSFASLDALKRSADAGYFHDGTRLHLNLVEQRDRGYAQVEICTRAGC